MAKKPTYEQLRQRLKELEIQAVEMRREKNEREQLVGELLQALAQAESLRGILVICSSCKKIRDDNGFWNEIEPYIKSRSQVEFSHTICPDCMNRLYPEYSETRDSVADGRRPAHDAETPQEETVIERKNGIERRRGIDRRTSLG
jgi:DNA repair exonuclease SbcCD ATPase subunit